MSLNLLSLKEGNHTYSVFQTGGESFLNESFLKHLFSNGCTANSGDQSGRLPSLYGDATAPGRRTWDSCAHAQGGSISASASIQPAPCGMDL